MNAIISKLRGLGMSEYEAKVYLALLSAFPATAYEAAKASGVPTSKVYEVLGRLLEKGAVCLEDEGTTKRYVPLEPRELISRYRSSLETAISSLGDDLTTIKSGKGLSYIWNITDHGYLTEKMKSMINAAKKTVLLSAWKQEYDAVGDLLARAVKRKVKAAVVHFGPTDSRLQQLFRHPIEDTLYHEKGGRGVVLVVDASEVLTATVYPGDRVEGAWSKNSGFVTMAEDYIKHDIYIMKIVKRFDRSLIKKFGAGYAKLRDIFNDEEEA